MSFFAIIFTSQNVISDSQNMIDFSIRKIEKKSNLQFSGKFSNFNSNTIGFYSNLTGAMRRNDFDTSVLKSTARGSSSINVYRKGSFGTVLVVTEDGVGSGAILTNKVHILTNQHVVGDKKEVYIFFKNGTNKPPKPEEGVKASVIKVDSVSDLALLYIDPDKTPSNKRPIPISRSRIEVGSDAHAIGHPSGQLWTYTKGYVSQVRNNFTWNDVHKADVLQIQTPINPGNSGGPLLNSRGELIGINTFKDTQNDSMNYAVTSSSINEFLAREGDRYANKPIKSKCDAPWIGEAYRTEDKGEIGPSWNRDFDINCDGVADSTLRAPDNKSLPLFTEMDTNADGKIDIILVDENRDESIEFSYIDSNHDGKLDKKGFHANGNPIPDRIEDIS